jgi:agmatine deiminase
VQTASGGFVQFRYAPDYLRGSDYAHLVTGPEVIAGIPAIKECTHSPLVIDGGNVVRCEDVCILTDKIFRENHRWKRERLLRWIAAYLDAKIIIIPTEPGDIIGHADGVVRFVDRNTVLVNDYMGIAPAYGRRVEAILKGNGLSIIRMPYTITGKKIDGIDSAFGNYVNFLQTPRCIIMPSYSIPEDARALAIVKDAFPGVAVESVDCVELSREGGVLNCISWDVVENPEG